MKFSHHFETKTRDSGESFTCLKDDAPDYMKDICMDAHDAGSMGPDDHRYAMIEDCFGALDNDMDLDSLEPPFRTHDLITWLGSHGDRPEFVNSAITGGYSTGTNIIESIAAGYMWELQEVFSVIQSFVETFNEEEGD